MPASVDDVLTVDLGLLQWHWNVFKRRLQPVIELTCELTHHLSQTSSFT